MLSVSYTMDVHDCVGVPDHFVVIPSGGKLAPPIRPSEQPGCVAVLSDTVCKQVAAGCILCMAVAL